ncbi:BgTH12-07630 [Blumeria graminis f. sp. triticale]|uniref:RING-type E3 ubiquitin transferase n=1 Tax=Blumeria graminis f. sp. triticale TaxID=1689686 RepID=A0A9W4GDG7_BLUGR|nr:BgTH12-07630 [Blumeria graminis f. sp. triticale]
MDGNSPPHLETPDGPDKDNLEQIRKRRLEKLSAGQKPAQVTHSETSSSTSSESKNADKLNVQTTIKDITKAPEILSSHDFSTTNHAQSQEPRTSNVRSLTKKLAYEETIEQYENKILGHIFCITLDPELTYDASHHRLTMLPNLRRDLEEENDPVLLTRDRLDSAILEAASKVPADKCILDYLLPCFKRVSQILTTLRDASPTKLAILKEAERLCISYCIFAIEEPDIFGRNCNPERDSLVKYLLLEPSEDTSADPMFIMKLLRRFDEDDSVRSILTKTASDLSKKLSKLTMNDSHKSYSNALKVLCQDSRIVTAITQLQSFYIADEPAPSIEKNTFLGPFFHISPLQPEITLEYFSKAKTMNPRMISTAQETLRMTSQAHQRDLLEIINLFVRASVFSRNKTLDWFAYVINSNEKRRALRPDPAILSTDGFLLNVTSVLDGLCTPFMDSTFSKIDKIDIDYLRRNPRINIKKETKLNADQDASDEFYDVVVDGNSNFISEIFFLTMAAHYYGTGGTIAVLKSLDKDIGYLEQKISQLELERPKFAHTPHNLARFEEQLNKFRDVLDKSCSLKYACEAVLFDRTMQAKSLMFMRYVTVWLLRVATATDYTPEKHITLPLSSEIPDAFRFLPEYTLEDVVGSFIFIFRHVPDTAISAIGDELIVLCITFLVNSEYIKNPYLKAKLVSLLFFGTWPVYHQKNGVIGDALAGSKFSNEYLLHALMKFYIDVECTGAHTQFYDKFNIRYEIFQVIKCIWTNNIYQQRLIQESKTNTEFFLRFVNLLLNDATYVLDEALTKFPKIHDLQQELKTNNLLSPEQRIAQEEELRTAESQAQSYMQLTNETVSMMKLFTKSLSASFTMPEIVDRVAAMLDYTLDILAGPKSTNLKVDDMKKFQFEPRTLLSEFVDIFLNLGVSENFIRAVAQDGRSYKPSNFEAAYRILTRYNLKSPEEINAWKELTCRFARAKEEDDQDEEDLGQIPDEFLDPLLASLMHDPVLLPKSQQIIDRSTIRSHLLSDPNDPFNRQPLRIEEVIELPEMKNKILAWKQEAKAHAKAFRQGAIDKMDTSDG